MASDRRRPTRGLLVSIRPRFAEAIISGAKRYELRRTRPAGAQVGMPVVLYATAPTSSIIAVCRIDDIVEGTREAVWEIVGSHSSVTRREFDKYFTGSRRVVALRLRSIRRLGNSVVLEDIRTARPEFHPPRTFRYVEVVGLNGQRSPNLKVSRYAGSALRFNVT